MHSLSSGVHALLGVLFRVTGNYGWAILLLTLSIRLMLLPLALWGQRAGKRTAGLQAAAKEIQAAYSGEEAQRRLTELYSQGSGAMLGGCLSALAQWPVLLAMYGALSNFTFAVPAGFLWMQNLAVPDPLFILPVLVIGTQIWQSLATLPKGQRAMALLLPLLMAVMLVKASAAVGLYWLASNLISLGQFYLLGGRRPRPA